MNSYKIMKEKHGKEINEFPMFFAFSDIQFDEGMKKLGLNPSETDKIYKLGGTGGFYKKSDASIFHEMIDRHNEEMKTAIANDDEFIFDMFNYVDSLGLTMDEVNKDKRLSDALKRACEAQKNMQV